MKILQHPVTGEEGSLDEGSILSSVRKLTKNRPDLRALVIQTLEKVEQASNLDFWVRTEWVGRLSETNEPIYEFRIPPKKRGGVVRIYFAYCTRVEDCIVLLSAELKKTSQASRDKIAAAERRYREHYK